MLTHVSSHIKNDVHDVTGTVSPNPFDQMVTASMIGGFNATIRSTPPASHLYLSTGKLPYTNFYYIIGLVTYIPFCTNITGIITVMKLCCFVKIYFQMFVKFLS